MTGLTVCFNMPVMSFDDLSCNSKSKPGAVFLESDKGIENIIFFTGRNPAAVIGNGNADSFFPGLCLQKDFSIRAGDGFLGIAKKI